MGRTKRRAGHIVILSSSYPSKPGDPAGHFVETEALALAKMGHPVTVFAPRVSGRLDSDGVTHLDLGGGELFGVPGMWSRARKNPLRLRYLLSTWRHLDREVKATDFNGSVAQVTSHWLFPGAWPWGCHLLDLLRAKGHCPNWEVVVHGSDARWVARWPRPFRHWLLRQLARRGARLRFVSAHLREQMEQGLPEELLSWLETSFIQPAALDVPLPDAALVRRRRQRALRGSQGQCFRWCLIVIGRLIPSKRVDVALTAATLIPDARVLLIGDGPERARLQNAHPHVWFLGQLDRSETLTWLAAADVLINASLSEGASTVVREAIALRTEVVTVHTGGEPKDTREGQLWTLSRTPFSGKEQSP